MSKQPEGGRPQGAGGATDKVSNGPNARPRNETIAQTGAGLPNDSSQPVVLNEKEAKAIKDAILKPTKGSA